MLQLNWNGGNKTYPHLQFPVGITGGYPVLTVELWAKVQSNAGPWTHFFTFATNENSNLYSYNCRLNGNQIITQVTSKSVQSNAYGNINSSLLAKHFTYISVSYNPVTSNITIYVNGSFRGVNKAKSSPPSIGVTSYNYIGQSSMSIDLGMIGQIDEFRIWAGELTAANVRENYLLGPNALQPTVSSPAVTSNSNSGLSSAAIGGISAAVVVFAILVAIAVFVVKHRLTIAKAQSAADRSNEVGTQMKQISPIHEYDISVALPSEQHQSPQLGNPEICSGGVETEVVVLNEPGPLQTTTSNSAIETDVERGESNK